MDKIGGVYPKDIRGEIKKGKGTPRHSPEESQKMRIGG